MPEKNILVFPSCMPRSIEYAVQTKRKGTNIIGSSSLNDDASKHNYSSWFYLPLISDNSFLTEFEIAISKYEITGIFTPNQIVWDYLNKYIERSNKNIELVNPSPIENELSPYRQANVFYNRYIKNHSAIAGSKISIQNNMSDIRARSIFRHSETIPGMCDHEKIAALFDITECCPKGDIVEIGSWWGKSAFIFNQLSQVHQIGSVLCVDPWKDDELKQESELVDNASSQVSASEAFDIFVSNLLPYYNNLNYLRMTSVEGSKIYGDNKSITTTEFGVTNYTGKIAILHIDGNHSLESVKADIMSWQKYLTDNAWVIFDDYEWAFGDGPKIVGDKFLADNETKINCSFIKGSALFLQLSTGKR